jgi:hypothetical protein
MIYENSAQTEAGRLRAHPARMIVPPVSAFAQTEVAIFAIVKQKPGTLNTRLFQSEQNNEYLLHHRRSGRGHRGRRLSRSAPLMNEIARKKLGPRGVPRAFHFLTEAYPALAK